ncbi:uncharacterized protein LOC117326751 [Pecten maximus]|uniref:uncharacterized protein LOC117326751 n=1 Tax=Pecten maximus TaxID=6579 RepID=UPI0014580EB3|nr:uncharacterized protein LOC117326751 [Pecten maximus]
MGNKESKVRLRIEEKDTDSEDEDEKNVREDIDTERDETPSPVTPYTTKTQGLSPSMVEKVRRCLSSLPLTKLVLTDELVERLASLVVVREYEADQDVICEGLKSTGIFIIDEGRVEVMTSAGEVIADLSKGDYFGEASVMYKVPCTATVRTNGKCRLLLLEEKVNRKLLGNVKIKMEMMDWFVAKRYIPLSANIDHERTIRRMVFTHLRKVPVFADWSDTALRSLVLEIKPALIVLYPPGSVVAMHGDPPVTINVIIRGRAVLCNRDRVTLADVDAHTDPVVIGEEGILMEVKNEVTVPHQDLL